MQLRISSKQLFGKERVNLSVLYPYGSDIWQPPPNGCKRVVFQNARGISRGPSPADEDIEATNGYGIDMYGVTKPNCAWSDDLVVAVNSATRKEFGYGFISASSMLSRKKGYFPGGAIQLIGGNVFGHHTKSNGEKYGGYTTSHMIWTPLNPPFIFIHVC